MRHFLKLVCCLFFCLSIHTLLFASTYYVSPNGSDTTGNGTSTAPWRTLTKAFSQGGGHTYILKDGTYNYSGSEIMGIPDGTAGGYTVIRAENNGEAIIATSSMALNMNHTDAYIQIEGIKFDNAYIKSVLGNHIKVQKCAFAGGPSTANTGNFAMGTNDYNDTHHILVEDCWFYGPGGRYKVLVYQSSQIVLRRLVVRDDGGWTDNASNPEAGICVYESSDVSCQNCIVIDSNLTTYDNNNVGAFYVTGHAGNPPTNNLKYFGCMALNNKMQVWHNDTDDGGQGCEVENFIGYDHEYGMGTSNRSMNISMKNITLGKFVNRALADYGDYAISVTNSILFNAGANYTGTVVSTYTDTYSPNDFSGAGIIHVNPLTNGLVYLPRIEAGSTLKTSGSSGGQMGAEIIKRYGVSGTLWGESGYNTLTSENLWPWPNEARIKTDMAADDARGFCTGNSLDGTPQTLTKYIWEYLGNQIPSSVYGITTTTLKGSLTLSGQGTLK